MWQHYPEIRRWNQSQEGSCGGHAYARAAMHELIKSGVAFEQDWAADDVSPGDRVSPAFAYYVARQVMGTTSQDSGVDNRSLFSAGLQYGTTREADMPYAPGQFSVAPTVEAYSDALKWNKTTYQSVVPTHGNLRATILRGNVVVQAFSVPDYFEEPSVFNPATGYLKLPRDVPDFRQYVGGHDTALTGWDYTCTTWPVPVFIVDNSWDDTDWGMAFDAPSGRVGRFAMDARWQGQSSLVWDLTALLSDS